MTRYRIAGITAETRARREALPGVFAITIDERTIEVLAERDPQGRWRIQMPDGTTHLASVTRDGADRWVQASGAALRAEEASGVAGGVEQDADLGAPMPGKVWKVLVTPGDAVEAGQTLIIIEAMKMEHAIKAPRGGVVSAVLAREEEMVEPGHPLVTLEDEE